MYIISLRLHAPRDESGSGRLGWPGGGLLVREEADPPDAEATRERIARGSRDGARDFEDGHSETPARPRRKRTRRALLPGGRAWPTPGVLRLDPKRLNLVPRGVHAHDPLRPPIHRGEAGTGRGRAALGAEGPRSARCESPPDARRRPEREGRGTREDPRRGRLHGGARPLRQERRRDDGTQLPDYGRGGNVSRSLRGGACAVPEAPSRGCRDVAPRRRGRPRVPVSNPTSPCDE